MNFQGILGFIHCNRSLKTFPTSVHFKIMAENMLSTNIKALQTDEGKEFGNPQFHNLFISSGISHRRSCPYTLQQMQSVECKKHLVETGLALLAVSCFLKDIG